MDLFRKWFYKMSQRAWEDGQSGRYNEHKNLAGADQRLAPYELNKIRGTSTPSNDLATDDAPTAVFRVVRAIGGSIVEARRYDPKTERHSTNLYLVQEDEDITESLGKIMTMEALR